MRKITRDRALRPCIRPAEKKDLGGLIALEELCYKEETFHKVQMKYLLLKARSVVLVSTIETKITASVIVLLRKHILNARIYSLNVHPSFRRRGIGGMLLDTAFKILKEKGFKKITLEVGINNRAAQDLYYSKGFFMDKLLKKYYKNGDDALHLIKKL